MGKAFQIIEVPEKLVLGIREAARMLNLHPQTLRRRTDLGLIPCNRDGKRREFLLSDIEKYIASKEKWVRDGNHKAVPKR
jgi:excisionase family DNA binding protein